ncbi:MAG: PEP-CTERM sorting domain-containing protein [Planctomycetaceae bacterium]|jgi:hypothetical protein|nr:PEP-CTERM sorting domain-containing protein [Planctomycetaceae bacterium]
MKRIYILLLFVSLFAFVVSAKAEYVSEQFTFGKVSGGQAANVELDFSNYDLTTASEFTFEFPLGLTSEFYFRNDEYGGDFEIAAGTTYLGTLNYNLGITATIGNSSSTLVDGTTPTDFELSYTIENAVKLSEGDPRYYVQDTQRELPSKLVLTANEFLNLLDEDNHLNLSFDFKGPVGNLDNFPYGSGISTGYRVEALIGEINVSFETAPVAPEPATLLIFGLAGLLGLPIARRFHHKSTT